MGIKSVLCKIGVHNKEWSNETFSYACRQYQKGVCSICKAQVQRYVGLEQPTSEQQMIANKPQEYHSTKTCTHKNMNVIPAKGLGLFGSQAHLQCAECGVNSYID